MSFLLSILLFYYSCPNFPPLCPPPPSPPCCPCPWVIHPCSLTSPFPSFQILIDHKGVGLFLCSLFYSIDVYAYSCVSTMLLGLLWPCSIVWYQCDTSNFLELRNFLKEVLKIIEGIFGLLWFYINFWNICFRAI